MAQIADVLSGYGQKIIIIKIGDKWIRFIPGAQLLVGNPFSPSVIFIYGTMKNICFSSDSARFPDKEMSRSIYSNKMRGIQKTLIVLAFLWPAILYAQTNIYVSPKGNDTNSGGPGKPFATIGRGLAEARKTPGNASIYLTEGTYYLNRPIIFTPEDSPKRNKKITIKNFCKQKVTISASVALNLIWEAYKNGIWKAKIKQDLIFDELLVNGQLQHMARYPNYDCKAQYLGGTAADAISKERAAGWKSPAGGYVHALHGSQWGERTSA